MRKVAIIIILLLIVTGFGFGLWKFNKIIEKNNSQTSPSTTQKQINPISNNINLNNISNSEILNIANGSMSNISYTFKSVLSKDISNGQLNVVLLGFMEKDGQYLTKKIDVSLEVIKNSQTGKSSIQIVPGSFENDTTPSNTTNNLGKKEFAINTVVNYLNSQGYGINATDWAVDSFPNQTIGQYTGNLVHVYETFDGNPTSVGWYLVGDNGTLYTAGATGNGPISAI